MILPGYVVVEGLGLQRSIFYRIIFYKNDLIRKIRETDLKKDK